MSILTRDQIEHVVGPGVLSEATMAALVDIGAKQADLVEAVAYVEGTDPGEVAGASLPPKAKQLAQVLEDATEWPDEDVPA